MREVMYNLSSILIVTILFICLVLAIEAGYRLGRKSEKLANENSRS